MRNVLAALALFIAASAVPATAADDRVVIHVDNSSEEMRQALAFAQNVAQALARDRERVEIVILVTGEAISTLIDFETLYGPSISRLQGQNVKFVACGNSLDSYAAGRGVSAGDLALVDGVTRVQVGVRELMRLQDRGYAYIRP